MNIPITDVYFALVNNNVIDIEHFSDEKATENEKAVMHIFSGRQQTVLSSVTSELKGASPAAFGSLGEEDQDYFTYIINQLKEKKILLQKSIDKTDEVYQEWQSGTISAQEYLNHAIAQNWIDIT
jgi:penicillin-binding protein 2